MTDQIILQLILTITQYCNAAHYPDTVKTCFNKIWNCGHKVTTSSVIITETHNCITKHINKEL